MKNEQIKLYLTKLRNEYEKEFQSISQKENIFKEVYADLKNFNFVDYKIRLEEEIKENLKEWWTNVEKGIVKEEELFAVLFEYGHYFAKGVQAESYGIGQWKEYEVKTEEFDMGFDYDFTTEFYAAPGLTLNFFDSLEKLDYSNLPANLQDDDIDEIAGYEELINLHKISGMINIQEVLQKLDNEKEFEELNYKNNFMFIIDEHDSGEVYPLLIKNK